MEAAWVSGYEAATLETPDVHAAFLAGNPVRPLAKHIFLGKSSLISSAYPVLPSAPPLPDEPAEEPTPTSTWTGQCPYCLDGTEELQFNVDDAWCARCGRFWDLTHNQ